MPDHEIDAFTKGVHNLLNDELIPNDAASDSNNWYTQDGRIKLIPGRLRIGAEGAVGSIQGQAFGYKVDGTKVHWRKIGTKIQYLNGSSVWTDVVTGLTATADYTFANYSSLAGTFTFAFGADGIFKMHNAFPLSYMAMYDSTKNFKGYAFIDRGRSILWNRNEDKTGLYGSRIDRQDATIYTAVANEVIGTGNGATLAFSGTLAFKGATVRNCFGVSVAVTGGETFTDNYLGVLTGSAGGTGTINYMTGAWTLTFTVAPANSANNIKATYQWENSNALGITDFTKSATRLAGEGFVFPQDEGGDAIQRVVIGQDGNYYSLKSQSCYQLALDTTDLAADNIVYRRTMGVPSHMAATSMSKGIVFMNTANPAKPELTILQRNPIGGDVEPLILFPQFKFANYLYDDCTIDTYERYIVIACKTANATNNDTILLCDLTDGTVDITSFNARTFANDAGLLYIGSSITQTVYQLFSGFDDDGLAISNFWASKAELLIPKTRNLKILSLARGLKKLRKLRLKGRIQPAQYYEVYVSYDDAGFQLVGTVRGNGSYVDNTQPQEIGVSIIGGPQVGGDVTSTVFPYFLELKLKAPKFRKRKVKFIAKGIGYIDIEQMADGNITAFEPKLPKRFRLKQNVSLDGQSTDQPSPSY
jgi:hypothetical protein